MNFWGATLWSAGVGLTAFDNAVKIQLSFGQFTRDQRHAVENILGRKMDEMRYGGEVVISGKVIAQLAYIPFNYFFGHDFDWLSATISIGANFSWFNKRAGDRPNSSILTSAFMQIEFPRMVFNDRNLFKTWAVYLEPALWFIPSDVASASTLLGTCSLGVRTSVF